MKRTTYILLGILVSGLVVMIAGIVILSIAVEQTKHGISFDGERIEQELSGVRAVRVSVNKEKVSRPKRILVSGEMNVTASSVPGKGRISYPKSEYLNVTQKNETLFVEFDFSALSIPQKYQDDEWLFVMGVHMNLVIDSTLNSIVTDVEELRLNLKEIKADSLLVRAYQQDVLLDSCQFRSFDLDGYSFNFYAESSKIENYYLNLDGVRDWTFENTEVGTEYLTGSGQHFNDLQKGECRRVIWIPRYKGADLKITLREKSEITITPE